MTCICTRVGKIGEGITPVPDIIVNLICSFSERQMFSLLILSGYMSQFMCGRRAMLLPYLIVVAPVRAKGLQLVSICIVFPLVGYIVALSYLAHLIKQNEQCRNAISIIQHTLYQNVT